MAKLYKDKNRQDEGKFGLIEELFRFFLNMTAVIYMIAMLVILPFYNQDGFKHIGTDKSVFFRTWGNRLMAAALCLAAVFCIVKRINLAVQKEKISVRKLAKRFLVTDYFAAGFGIAVVLSHFCSMYRSEAKWGAAGWFMGTLPQLILVGSYFLVSAGWEPNRILPFLTLPVSAVVFLLGIVNKFGVYPIDMKVKNPGFISTIGNINWFCGYLVVVLFFAIGYFIFEDEMKKWLRILFAVHITLGFAALETQGSDSGILALGIMLVVLFCFSSRDSERLFRFATAVFLLASCGLIIWIIRKKEIWKVLLSTADRGTELLTNSIFAFIFFAGALALLIVSVILKRKEIPVKILHSLSRILAGLMILILAGYVIFLWQNTVKQGAIGEKLGLRDQSAFVMKPEWGSNRGATWGAGAMVFAEQNLVHKLVGVGPDCMSAYIYSDGSEKLVDLVTTTFGTAKLTNAHNEWLTILVDEGILGLITFAGMIGTAVVLYLRRGSKNAMACACGLAVLAYTVNNIFSFQQSMCTPTMFIFLGIGAAWLRAEKEKESPK